LSPFRWALRHDPQKAPSPGAICFVTVYEDLNMNPSTGSPYLSKVIEGIWSVAANTLGENHLLTMAFETAYRSNDPELMERALHLLGGCPAGVKQKVLWGSSTSSV
jgi:hypothetical protein